MAYRVELRPDAVNSIGKLNRIIAQRIVKKLIWLSENFEDITPEPLTGDLKGLYKLRVGHYRIIYSVKIETICVHLVGHRSEIYK